MIDLYIYYRVREEHAPVLQGLVSAMQARLSLQHGVPGQLKRRPDSKDGVLTWMEVYPATPDGFQCALDSAVLDAGLQAWTAGPRHTEIFMDLPPCV